MATTTGSRYDHIAIQDGSNTTLHYLTDNRYPDVPNDSTKYLRGDGAWNTIDISTPYVAGTGTKSAVLDSGASNVALGQGSVAEGSHTTAKGEYSNSTGCYTISAGPYSYSDGYYTTAVGSYSHVEGGSTGTNIYGFTGSGTSYTTTSELKEYLLGKQIAYNNKTTYITSVDVSNKTITVNDTLGTLNSANCSIYYAGTSAYGHYSHAEGYGVVSKGNNSHAEGELTISVGNNSHAEGSLSQTGGQGSHAEGLNTISFGSCSHAEGNYAISVGICSHSEGGGSNVKTLSLTGSGTSYTASSSIDILYDGKPITYGAVTTYITSVDTQNKTITVKTTLGTLSSATCTLRPYACSAYGERSHAEGASTTSKGNCSHAEGDSTMTTSSYSHAEGCHTISDGSCSHAEGGYTKTTGQYSHAEGYHTIASGQYQHVSGKYNVEDLNNTYAEIVGIGNMDSARTNGRTLDWAGNEQLAGSLTLGLGTANQTTITATQLKQLLALLS